MLRSYVATRNIHKDMAGIARRVRVHNVWQDSHSMDADIVFLQRVQDRNDRLVAAELFGPNYTQLRYPATDIYPHTVHNRNVVYKHRYHGNAIPSWLPILLLENLDISDRRLEQCGLPHAVTDLDSDGVHLLCAHFGLFIHSRQRQAETLADRVCSVAPLDAPLVMADDFDDWNSRLDRTICQALGATEVAGKAASTRPVYTFPGHMPRLHLNRVYVYGFDVKRTHALADREWTQCSDHVPLLAELTHP